MKRWLIGTALFLSCIPAAGAQTLPANGDLRAFELTPSAPPVPALKYELLFDPSERRSGNAALLYFQAEALLSQSLSNTLNDAEEASAAVKDHAAFDKLVESLHERNMIALLNLAARCDVFDPQAPVREMGSGTLLPYLSAERAMANLLMVRAVYDIRKDNLPESLSLIRAGLEMGRKMGQEPILVSGLVAQGIIGLTLSQPMTELMNRPDAPNLYWALASLPRPLISMQRSWGTERIGVLGDAPELASGKIDDLSGQQWRAIFDHMVEYTRSVPRQKAPESWADPVSLAYEVIQTRAVAEAYYARTRNIPADQAAKLNPFKLVATYWYEQYRMISDEQYKMTALPFPLAIAGMKDVNNKLVRMVKAQPGNVFLARAGLSRFATAYARVDRQIAALTAVEAIRSYAAGYDGKLPLRLADVTDTPVLDNPMTGKPFDYTVQGDSATLADPDGDGLPLKYTIRIRK